MFGTSIPVNPSRNRACPRCQDYALRVRRRLIDRILHPIEPVRRYRCMSMSCGWTGNLKPRERGEARNTLTSTSFDATGSGSEPV